MEDTLTREQAQQLLRAGESRAAPANPAASAEGKALAAGAEHLRAGFSASALGAAHAAGASASAAAAGASVP